MTPGQLVKATAIAMDVQEETVVQHDRNLAVAGLRTTGARGRNAPNVTPLDAARLLIAVLASVRTADSAETVKSFEQTKFELPKLDAEMAATYAARGVTMPKFDQPLIEGRYLDPTIMALPADHNPIDAIAALISEASLPIADFEKHLKRFASMVITCETGFTTTSIGFPCVAQYQKPKKSSKSQDVERPPLEWTLRCFGIFQRRDVFGIAIILLGRAFRENGLHFKSTKDALADMLKTLAHEQAKVS